MGQDITKAVLSILHSGRYLNYTHIVLLPKKNNPQYITKYRPISGIKAYFKGASKSGEVHVTMRHLQHPECFYAR